MHADLPRLEQARASTQEVGLPRRVPSVTLFAKLFASCKEIVSFERLPAFFVSSDFGFRISFGLRPSRFGFPAIIATGMIVLCCVGCSTTGQPRSEEHLLPSLQPYVKEIANELGMVSAERRVVLDAIASNVSARLESGKAAQLTFICTHNSRRSHMSQVWAQTAAYYFGLDDVSTFSGGTEATACNCRTVAAMRRVGFSIEDATTGDNPVYLVRYATDRPPIRAYSKLYNADANPKQDFIALMTCSVADKTCPVVQGATARYAIHYADPRLCDDTPTETAAYNERCREIAREMFYIMSEVRRQRGGVTVAQRH
jgi:arsenate reductase